MGDALRHHYDECTDLGDSERIAALEAEVARLRAHNAELADAAFRDPLTGLYNRRFILELLERRIKRVERYGGEGVLFYADLDRFKPINDSFGHATGDRVLVQFARLLSAHIRESDCAARLGGDEFVILFDQLPRIEIPAKIRQFGDAIAATCFGMPDQALTLRASFGWSVAAPGGDAAALLNEADSAMYAAKLAQRSDR